MGTREDGAHISNENEISLPGERSDRISTMRRALLKMGWTAPVITVVTLPKSGFAANISGGNNEGGNNNNQGGNNNNQS